MSELVHSRVFNKNNIFLLMQPEKKSTDFDQAVFDLLIYTAHKAYKLSLSNTIMISIPEMRMLLDKHSKAKRSGEVILTAAKALARVNFTFNEMIVDTSCFESLIEKINFTGNFKVETILTSVEKQGNALIFEMTEFFWKHIRGNNEYTKLSLDISMQAKHKHTISIYQFVMSYLFTGECPWISVKDLSTMLQVNYDSYENLNKFILKKVVENLKYFGVELTYVTNKAQGKKLVTDIKFSIANYATVCKNIRSDKLKREAIKEDTGIEDKFLAVPYKHSVSKTVEIFQTRLNSHQEYEDFKIEKHPSINLHYIISSKDFNKPGHKCRISEICEFYEWLVSGKKSLTPLLQIWFEDEGRHIRKLKSNRDENRRTSLKELL